MPYDAFPSEILAAHIDSSDGLHRIRWKDLYGWAEQNLNPETWIQAWDHAELFAAERLRESLGGDYKVSTSDKVILLSNLPPQDATWTLQYVEKINAQLCRTLPGLVGDLANGRDVILVFSDHDTYYRYISHYFQDGEHAQSGGICLHDFAVQIALTWIDQYTSAQVLIHELIHSSLSYLTSLPLWLNEGLAQTLERSIGPNVFGAFNSEHDFLLNAELAERHLAYWTPDNIQGFWTGESFGQPGDPQELSYNLAEILVKLICEKTTSAKFAEFIAAATYEDAGQSAALEFLNQDLAQITATFLGPGSWSPSRSHD